MSLISELYNKNKSVKEYLEFYIKPDEKAILKKYKLKVREAFYPKRGFGFKLASGKKAISEFRKLKPTSGSLIDLMLHYVECGVEFTNEFGYIYEIQSQEILMETENIGWGFHDSLSYSFYEFYI